MEMPHPLAAETRRYVDSETLFSLHVPPGWLVDTSGQQGARVLLLSPTLEANFRPTLNVLVQDLRCLTKQEFLTLTRLQLKLFTGQPRPDRDEQFPGLPGAQVLEWTASLNGMTLTMCQLLVISGGKAYILTGTAPADCLARYRMAFQTVFGSFAPPPGTLSVDSEPIA